MTGLDKMKSQILEEAKAEADSRIAKARQKAAEILEEAQTEAAKSVAGISRKSETDAANYRERIASSVDLQKRTRILQAKQEMIAQILEQSYERVKNQKDEDYFELILKMIENYAFAQEGVIYFSKRDLARMPKGYPEKIQQAALAKGGALTISAQERKIENGFVLAYGGIEENCTLEAIFDAKRDELGDKVHRLLFA